MNVSFRFLCNDEGQPLFVQIPYDEYEKTVKDAELAEKMSARIEAACQVLGAVFSEGGAGISGGRLAPASVPVGPNAGVPQKKAGSPARNPEPPPGASAKSMPLVAFPPALGAFVNEQDPSGEMMKMLEECVRRVAGVVGRRITASLNKPYICLWDFDQCHVFACCEIASGRFRVSMERSLLPDVSDVWTPPSGVFKKPMARMDLRSITDEIINLLQAAVRSVAA